MKSENWIILEFAAILASFGVLSFFMVPAYEKGGWEVMMIFSTGLGTVLGYKFGKNMPQQSGDAKLGQTTQSETKVTTIPVPPSAGPTVEEQSDQKGK
jgi:hypothetical protein